MAAIMFAGMIAMALAFWFYSIAAAMTRVRCIMLERERSTEWAASYLGETA
jgi:heme exporter protein C